MIRVGLVAVAVLLSPASAIAQDKPSADFEARLQKLESLLEQQRVENHIPGLALAVVKDDKIVFAKGFGLRDVAGNKPVETNTRFAIGSSTKAFTAALIGLLVDEGKMKWDDPVSKHIPDFRLDVETDGSEVTIRDLLCHRTGFTRMGLIWAGGQQSRSEVLAGAANAKPYAKFREKFLYNNVMYMAAGYAAGKTKDSTWDSLIAERFFKPLEMNNSNTSISAASKDADMSLGYQWQEESNDFRQLPMRDLNSIAPAGAINSNVVDMAQWIRFQLARGKFKDRQLLSPEQHAETWKKQMTIGGGVNYGFGWMLREWQGEKVIEHGGNIDGFGAQVSLLPKHNAGYVLLTNVTATPLQGASVSLVFDTLFGEEQQDRGLASVNTDELVGTYIANFAVFDGAKFEVKMKGDKLAVDVPGQTLYELKSPDKDGKWFFALTDTVALSFNKDDQDKVISMSFYQAGMEPEFLREGYEPKPDAPLDVTTAIVGKYQDPDDESELEVTLKQGRLVANAGKRGIFALLPPDEDGNWALRARPDLIKFRFNKNDDGTTKSITRIQGDKEVEMMRMATAKTNAKVPSVQKLLAKMREKTGALSGKPAGIRLNGTANFIHQGVTGTVETIFTADGKHATRQDFGKIASMVEVFDGTKAFSVTSMSPFEELKGSKFVLAKLQHPAWNTFDWNQHYPDAAIEGETKIDGDRVFIVGLSGEGASDRKLYIAEESGLVVREIMQIPIHNVGQMSVDVRYSDFRKVDGVMLPFKAITENAAMGQTVVEFESAEELTSIPDGTFVAKPNAKK